uniref:Uncharacterized protein n=1 Tax=Anguilla anguilla TaxID=7936 RepID=A0A0E9X3H8_ANGAN
MGTNQEVRWSLKNLTRLACHCIRYQILGMPFGSHWSVRKLKYRCCPFEARRSGSAQCVASF